MFALGTQAGGFKAFKLLVALAAVAFLAAFLLPEIGRVWWYAPAWTAAGALSYTNPLGGRLAPLVPCRPEDTVHRFAPGPAIPGPGIFGGT